MIGTATLSADGIYRYRLGRRWAPGAPVVWAMLNPSTADDSIDDPTIRRCISFTKTWGYGALEVVNVFAMRATKPVHLLHHPDPVGPENREHVRDAIRECAFVVAAWGAGVEKVGGAPWVDILRTASDLGAVVECLGKTAAGHPRHPLYVAGDTPLRPFSTP